MSVAAGRATSRPTTSTSRSGRRAATSASSLHRCTAVRARLLAGVVLHRPRPRRRCSGRTASGRGEVHTYTIVHHPYDPSLADRVPYALAVVKLDEGPFFHTDIVGCDAADVHVGMRVEVVWERLDAETVIPHFAPEARSRERTS